LTIDPGAHFLCDMPAALPATMTGIFEAVGDAVSILVQGGEAIVESLTASPYLYAAMMRGHSGFTVAGLSARECQHVCVTAATDDYCQVRTGGPEANVARQVVVRGGGAQFGRPQKEGQGACLFQYAVNCQVQDARYVNVPHGVQWWGGDADPVRPPAQGLTANERKCRNLTIRNVAVHGAEGGGIWGSMGQDVHVVDCAVDDVGDVGFDAEGSNAVVFERCFARNAPNGCFSTFFLCDGVRFVDCHGVVDDARRPIVRIYNSTLNGVLNRRVEIVGGLFECLDTSGSSSIDTIAGPVGQFVLSGATLRNVRIDLAYHNMHSTRIVGNDLSFPHPLHDVAAIRAGASKATGTSTGKEAGSVLIDGNRIRYTAQRRGEKAVAIAVREDDFNGEARDVVRRNSISGPFDIGISIVNASPNLGIVPRFAIAGNRFVGLAPSSPLLVVSREGGVAAHPAIAWDRTQTSNGKAASLPTALGRRS
jgi:hypothetical protein